MIKKRSKLKRKMTIRELQKICHKIAVEKGFWNTCYYCRGKGKIEIEEYYFSPMIPTLKHRQTGHKKYKRTCPLCRGRGYLLDRNDSEMLMLMVSELGEACEDLRQEKDKHVGEELADCVIRIMDYCEGRDIDLQKEILNKIKKNRKRKYKHSKKF